MIIIIVCIGNNDLLNELNCKSSHFSNNRSEGDREFDDFLQMTNPLETFVPSLSGKTNKML